MYATNCSFWKFSHNCGAPKSSVLGAYCGPQGLDVLQVPACLQVGAVPSNSQPSTAGVLQLRLYGLCDFMLENFCRKCELQLPASSLLCAKRHPAAPWCQLSCVDGAAQAAGVVVGPCSTLSDLNG